MDFFILKQKSVENYYFPARGCKGSCRVRGDMTGCQYDPHSRAGPSGFHCEPELSDVIITAWTSNWTPPLPLSASTSQTNFTED